MFNNQGNSKPEASHSENGDMAWAGCEELVELDDVQLATVVGGVVYVGGTVTLKQQLFINRQRGYGLVIGGVYWS